MTERLRILHLASSERWTGIAEPVTSLALYQQQTGEVDVWLSCIPGRSFEHRAIERGVRVLPSFAFSRNYITRKTIRDVSNLIQIIAEKEINVVHCHLSHDHWLAAFALRFLKRNPVLLVRSMHRFAAPYKDPVHRWLLERATDLIITPTRAIAHLLKNRFHEIEQKVQTVYGAVDINRFSHHIDSQIIRTQYRIEAQAPVAGLVARLRKDRGIEWLLDTIPLVLGRFPTAYFIIVGRGELKYWLRDYIEQLPYRDRIMMPGYRTHDLPEIYAALDCSLFLGLGSDGSSRAVLEAMSTGKPVIALNRGGIDEVIQNGVNGILVPPGDRNALASALCSLFNDRNRAALMGEKARRTIEQHFTEERRSRETNMLYRMFQEIKASTV